MEDIIEDGGGANIVGGGTNIGGGGTNIGGGWGTLHYSIQISGLYVTQ